MQEKIDERLGYLVKRTQQALRNAMDRELKGLSLTTSQYAVLTVLEHDTGLSNAELARRCFVTPQTMHQIMLGLEQASLLGRTSHPEHGRIQVVTLTKEGKKLVQKAHAHVLKVEAQMVAGLNQVEQKQLKHALLGMSQALEGKD